MSAKKKRGWFVCPQWQTLVASHYPDDAAAAKALHAAPRVLEKLRAGTPVAKSTLLKVLRKAAGQHALPPPVDALVVDTRPR